MRLEEQVCRDSRTSSKPPSPDPRKTRAQQLGEARAQGWWTAGHLGAARELKTEDQVDEIVDHYPEARGGCGRRFDEEQRRPGGRSGRHQVCELPPISVI
jgi:hypothetical protein